MIQPTPIKCHKSGICMYCECVYNRADGEVIISPCLSTGHEEEAPVGGGPMTVAKPRRLCLLVPVALPAKKLVAWVVWTIMPDFAWPDVFRRRVQAREEAAAIRKRGLKTRGPVKVEVEL